MDAALFSSRGLTSFDCVLRGPNGDFISTRAVSVCLWLQPHEAEAMSVREALAWLKLGNISNVIVEMDSQMVYNALIAQTSANSPFSMLIEGYQDLVSKLDNVSFSLVRRSANSVPHCVVRASVPCQVFISGFL